jgi:hypothetical protein
VGNRKKPSCFDNSIEWDTVLDMMRSNNGLPISLTRLAITNDSNILEAINMIGSFEFSCDLFTERVTVSTLPMQVVIGDPLFQLLAAK